MNNLHRLEHWGDTHHSKWLDIVRVALGIFLCFKAISFLNSISVLQGMHGSTNMSAHSFSALAIGHAIVILQLLGGIFIALGLHTRLVSIIQIPLLVGAFVFLYVSGIPVGFAEVLLSALVLLLLILFIVEGNGPWSYDRLFHEEDKHDRSL